MNKHDILETLIELAGAPSSKVSGNWHHYQCFMCDDHSKHLGINVETGAVRCLRCGFKFSLEHGKAKDPIIHNEAIDQDQCSLERETVKTEPFYLYDRAIYRYMLGRGVVRQTGWGYGRGGLMAKLVFPCYSKDDRINYIQWRSGFTPADRYRSHKMTVPRFDHYPMIHMSPAFRDLIILTEGPMDAHVVRSNTGLWCSPMYGTNPGHFFLDDLKKAYDRHGIKRLFIMLDNDNTGRTRTQFYSHLMKSVYGMNTIVIETRFWDGKDPAENDGYRALYRYL